MDLNRHLFAELTRALPPVFEQVLHRLAQSRVVENQRSPGRLADHWIEQSDQSVPSVEAGEFQRQRRRLPDLDSRRGVFGQPLPLMRIERSALESADGMKRRSPAPASPAFHQAGPPHTAGAKTPDIPPSLPPAFVCIRPRFGSAPRRFSESPACRGLPFLPNTIRRRSSIRLFADRA